MRVEKEAEARRERIDCEPARDRPVDILDAVTQREREFLNRGRSGFADVIPGDRNRIEARHPARSRTRSESVTRRIEGRGG